MFHFAKNVSFTAVDVFGMTKERPDLVRASFAAAMELVAAGHVRAPRPVQVYPVSQLEAALRHMQSGKSMGKLVIEMNPNENVLVRPFVLDHVKGETLTVYRPCSGPSQVMPSTLMLRT
jgi:hypothetical protein